MRNQAGRNATSGQTVSDDLRTRRRQAFVVGSRAGRVGVARNVDRLVVALRGVSDSAVEDRIGFRREVRLVEFEVHDELSRRAGFNNWRRRRRWRRGSWRRRRWRRGRELPAQTNRGQAVLVISVVLTGDRRSVETADRVKRQIRHVHDVAIAEIKNEVWRNLDAKAREALNAQRQIIAGETGARRRHCSGQTRRRCVNAQRASANAKIWLDALGQREVIEQVRHQRLSRGARGQSSALQVVVIKTQFAFQTPGIAEAITNGTGAAPIAFQIAIRTWQCADSRRRRNVQRPIGRVRSFKAAVPSVFGKRRDGGGQNRRRRSV